MAGTKRRGASPLSPLYLARRQALYKGILGGSNGWMRVGWVVGFLPPGRAIRLRTATRLVSSGRKGGLTMALALIVPSLLRRTVGRTPQRVASVRLDPNTAMKIETFGPPSRSARRQARRQSA